MRNFKKLTVVLIIMTLIIGVTNIVLATEADENVTFIPDELTNNNTINNTTNNATTNSTENLFGNTNTSINNTVNNANSSKYNNTNLPNAGSEDGIVTIMIAIAFGVSAIYAYKKIRDYNIK